MVCANLLQVGERHHLAEHAYLPYFKLDRPASEPAISAASACEQLSDRHVVKAFQLGTDLAVSLGAGGRCDRFDAVSPLLALGELRALSDCRYFAGTLDMAKY